MSGGGLSIAGATGEEQGRTVVATTGLGYRWGLPEPANPKTAPAARVALALAAVYLVWGSTYLGIRVAIESIPPLLMAGFRFGVAGALLLVYAGWIQRAPWPAWPQWRDAIIVGACLLLVGNGGVTLAELQLPSGLTAMLVATVPMFLIVFAWLAGMAARPGAPVVLALAIGFGGVGLLVHPAAGMRVDGPSVALVLVAAAVWAGGSLYARRAARAVSPVQNIGMQMLAGGLLLALAGALRGEPGRVHLAAITLRSAGALAYLTLIGSVVGFSAYVWLLSAASPALVGTYAFVNPAVAVLLGWALAGEAITVPMILGMAAILTAVALILRFPARPPAPIISR